MNIIDPLFFEKVLIKILFTNNTLNSKIMPFIIPDVFTDINNIGIINVLIDRYHKCHEIPSINDMEILLPNKESYDIFIQCINLDISKYNNDLLLDRVQRWFKSKLIWNHITDAASKINSDKVEETNDLADKIREANLFNFDVKIGTDLFKDADIIYDALTTDDNVITTGLVSLDRLIKGGYHEKTTTIYLGETNIGKTLVLAYSASQCLMNNKKVLYVTGEMSEYKIDERVVCNILDIDINNIEKVGKENFIVKMKSAENYTKGQFITKEYPTSGFNVGHIRSLLKELRVKMNYIPDIIFIDYIGIMQPLNSVKNQNDYSKYKTISEEVRGLAVESGIPIVSADQSNRDGFYKVEIDLRNTSDSIGKAFTADIIVAITQPPEFAEMNPPCFSFQILKNRYGMKWKKFVTQVDYSRMRLICVDENKQQPIKSNNINDGLSIITDMNKINNKITSEEVFDFE